VRRHRFAPSAVLPDFIAIYGVPSINNPVSNQTTPYSKQMLIHLLFQRDKTKQLKIRNKAEINRDFTFLGDWNEVTSYTSKRRREVELLSEQ